MVKKTNKKDNLLEEFDGGSTVNKDEKVIPQESDTTEKKEISLEEAYSIVKEKLGNNVVILEDSLKESDNATKEVSIEEAYSVLKYNLNDREMSTSPLEELYLKLSHPELGDDWDFEDGVFQTRLEFATWEEVKPFQELMFDEGLTWELENKTEEGFTFSVSTTEASKVTKVEEVFESLNEDTETYSQDNKEKPLSVTGSKVVQNFSQSTTSTVEKPNTTTVPVELKKDEVTCFSMNQEFLVKLPIIQLGHWHHEQYGEIVFDNEVIEEVRTNLENNELGFEPPLFEGHQFKTSPAVGFLRTIEFNNEDNILYGIWETNAEVYDQIKRGVYRYSSSEFSNDFLSKKSGERIGKVLIGMALTNKPFMPDLPRNVALSDEERKNTYSFSMELNILNNKKNTMEKSKDNNQPELEELREELNSYKSELEKYSTQLEAVKTAYEEQLGDANTRIKELNERIRQGELEKKLSKLNSLNLPQEQKDKYKSLFEQGSLGNSEDAIMESLEDMSKTYSSEVFTQQGNTEATQKENEESNKSEVGDSPHMKRIQENYELVKARKKALQEAQFKRVTNY